ncbi:unnamed protein product, partial [Prorocentrum cordatum]
AFQRQARAPQRPSDASFGLLRAMGAVEGVGAVAQLLAFHRQGSDADLRIES